MSVRLRHALRRIALSVALLVMPGWALAEDVTLLSREGTVVVSGVLQSYDGEFYRITSRYGALTIDAEGVICDGPACPELVAPRASLRIIGPQDAGLRLLPDLFRRFAAARGLTLSEQRPEGRMLFEAELRESDSGAVLADLSFIAATPEEARLSLAAGAAEFYLTANPGPAAAEARPLALDAMVPIMAPGNPTPSLSTPVLAAVLAGEARNWRDFGGPDMPIVLHAIAPDSDIGLALAARLGTEVKADITHRDVIALAEAVARDPWALAVTGLSFTGPAGIAPMTDSCGFPILPLPVSVKAGDYPLSLPLYLLPAPRRPSLVAREFLEFLATPQAESIVAAAGYIDRSLTAAPMTQDGLRLLNAIRGAGEDVTLADLKRLAEVMEGADRLSLTFRFEEGTSVLDAESQENLRHLARLIAARHFPDKQLILAGFSDGTGDAAANRALSEERAGRVVQDLAALAQDLPESALPLTEGFGEALPMACDETAIGRRLNRRVELWLVPDFTPQPL